MCVCLCVCVGMCVLQWHFHAPCNKNNERGVDDVEEEEELGPQWRKGVVNAQKRLQPQSRPEANLASVEAASASAPCNGYLRLRVKELREPPNGNSS